MTGFQFLVLAGMMAIAIAAIPWSVNRAVEKRWDEIRLMFDRALMHGGSLDTLGKALKATSEASRIKAEEAINLSNGALEGLQLLHERVKRLEEHPLLRPLGGSGHKGETP